jgi:hypothetical protein
LTVGGDERVARYIEAAREREYGRLALAEPGDRNNALNRAAFALGQLIGPGRLDRDAIEDDLLKVALRIGLDEHEAQPTIKSGLDAGIAQPRDVPTSSSVETVASIVQADEWPRPFLDIQPVVTPFPIQVLPGSLRDLCEACADSYGCPVDFFAVPGVLLAGGVIGMSVNLRISTTWEIQPHLYCVVVAPPGDKKSPALDLMSRPLAAIDQELQEEFRLAQANALPEDPRPLHRHLLLDDFTRESATLNHSQNPRGLVICKDELVGLTQTLDAYRKGGGDVPFLLSVNSGSPIKVNRKGNNGESYTIPRPCIAIIGGLTPARLEEIRV